MSNKKLSSWTRIERLLAMNLLATCDQQRHLTVAENADMLRRCGFTIQEIAEILGTSAATIRIAKSRERGRKG
jgi:hypothetical protein